MAGQLRLHADNLTPDSLQNTAQQAPFVHKPKPQHVCACRRVKGQLAAVGPQLGGLAASVAVATLWLTRRGRTAGGSSGGGSDGGLGGGGGGSGGGGGDGGPSSEAAKVRIHLPAPSVYRLRRMSPQCPHFPRRVGRVRPGTHHPFCTAPQAFRQGTKI